MTEQFANNASSTLNGAITNVATTLVVTSAATFPTLPNFRLLIGISPITAEIILVTGVSGTTFTILRGQEGTAAIGWADLTTVTHILTAGAVNQVITGGGDLSGKVENATVAKIKGNPVATQSLGASQDGYALTWNNTDGYWYAKATAGGAVSSVELSFVSWQSSTGLSTFQRVGGRSIDISKWPATLNGLARTISFFADVQKTITATSVEVQLFDVTNNTLVTSTNLTSTSLSLATISALNLTVGASAGNIRSDTSAQYEVQLKMNGGNQNDQVYCINARLLITYA